LVFGASNRWENAFLNLFLASESSNRNFIEFSLDAFKIGVSGSITQALPLSQFIKTENSLSGKSLLSPILKSLSYE
jgi:hypothetical protein